MTNELNSLLTSMRDRTSVGSAPTEENELGYASTLNKDNAKNVFSRNDFVQDVYDYYYERDGKSFSSVNEARDYFMEDRRWRNMNLVSIGRDVYDANTQSDNQSKRLARLQTTFDAMPDFYQEGGDGWKGFGTNALAVLADPINLVGFGSGGIAARGAAAGVIAAGGRNVVAASGMSALRGEASRAALKAGVLKGAMYEGAASGVAEGFLDAGIQARNTELGLQDGYSLAQGAMAVAGGALIDGAVGGVLGGIAARVKNPFTDGQNQTQRGIADGEITEANRMNAEVDGAAEDARLLAEETGATAPTAAQRYTETVSGTRSAVNTRTAASRSGNQPDVEGEPTDRVDSEQIDATTLTEEDQLDLAAQNVVDLDELATKTEADAALETDINKRNALNERAMKMRRASERLHEKLGRYLSPDEVTSDELIAEIKQISDQSDLLKFIESDAVRSERGLRGSEPEQTGGANGGTVRNVTQVEAQAAEANEYNDGSRPGDGGTVTGDEAPDLEGFSSNGTLAGRNPTAEGVPVDNGPDKRMGPTAPEPELSPEDAEFAGRLEESKSNGVRLDERVSRLNENIATTQQSFDAAGTLTGETDDITQILKDGALAEGADPEIMPRLAGIAQQNGVEMDASQPIEALIESLSAKKAERAVEKAGFEQKIKDLRDELEVATKEQSDNVRLVDSTQKNYAADIEARNKRLADEAEQAKLDKAIEATRAEAELDQAARDARDPSAVYGTMAKKTDAVNYLKELGATPEDMKPFTSLDGRSNAAAREQAFVAIWNKKVGQGLLGNYAAEMMDENGPIDLFFNTDKLPDSEMSFFEVNLLQQGWEPDLRKAAVEAHETYLSNPDELDKNVMSVFKNPHSGPSGFMDLAQERFGRTYAERLDAHINKDITDTIASRKMGTPSGEKAWGMTVRGAKGANPTEGAVKNPLQSERREFVAGEDTDGRVKEIEAVMSDALNDELNILKDNARKVARQQGFSEDEAEIAASKMYSDKINQLTEGRENFVERNNKFLLGQQRKVASGIVEMKEARDAFNASRVGLPKKFNSTLVSEDVIVQELNEQGELVDLEKIRYTLEQSSSPTIEEQQLLKAHFKALERLREVKRRYTSVAGYNVVMKNNGTLPVGQLIRAAEDEISVLQSKMDTTIKIVARGLRQTKSIAIHEDKGLADHMARSQVRDGRGVYEAKGKIQSIIKGAGIRGFTGNLFRQTKSRDSKGVLQHSGAISTAIDDIQRARIESGTLQKVRDEIEATRNKPRIDVLDASIEKITRLQNKINSAEKQLKKNPESTIKFDKNVVTLGELQDMLDSTLSDVRANVVKVNDMGPTQSILAGLKAEKTRLSQNTQKGMLGNQAEEANKDRGRVIMLSTWGQIKREMANPDTTDERRRFLTKMKRDLARMGNKQKKDGKPYDVKLAERIANFANRKEAKGRKAEAIYQRDVEAGMYNYDSYNYGADANRFDTEDAGLADAYADQMARRDAGEVQFDDGDLEAAFFGGSLPPVLKDEVKKAANQKKVNEVVRRDSLAEYAELNRKAQKGEVSPQELVTAIAELQKELVRRQSATPEAKTVVGRKHTPQVASTPAGVEVDVNNDITYSRPKGSEIVTLKIDGEVLGEAIGLENGGFSIMHPDGQRLRFKSFGPLKQSLVQIYTKKITEIQEKSKNTRFAVKETAKGIPHTQLDPEQTATYKGSKQVPAEKGKSQPEEIVKPDSNPNDVTTWSGVDFEDMPAGRVLAIQFLADGPRVKRQVLRVDNSKKPQSVSEMLGVSGDVPYVIGHVQAGKSKAAQQETFFPMDAEDTFIDQRGVEIVGLDVPEGKRGLSANSQSRRKRENRASDFEKVKDNALKIAADDKAFFEQQGVSLNTISDLVNHIERLETADWQGEISTLQGLKKFSTLRAAASRILRANVPNGIKKPTVSARKANEQLRTMFDGYPQTEVQTAVDFIERVALMNGGVAPSLRAGDGAEFDPNTNQIQIKVSEKGAVRATPMSMELVHEVGHWVYDNLLDEGDKQKFWSSMEKYYDDNGQLDFKLLEGGLVDPKLISNAAANPQEFFANQFLGYALQTDAVRAPGSALMKVFEKVSQIGKDLMNWMLGKETFKVDADLHAIFQKYMPQDVIDTETGLPKVEPSAFGHLEEVGRVHGNMGETTVGSMTMKPAEFAGRQMRVLDERIRELNAAKRASPRGLGDSMSLAIDLERIAKATYGEYGGPVGQPTHKKIPGRPDSGKARLMALDGVQHVREPIIQAQYAIHSFLKKLRAEEADHKFASMLEGMSTRDKASQEAIVAEMAGTEGARDSQQMYERMLTDSKSAYEGLDEAIVDHLHRLSSDLQSALQGAIGEYTGMFQRTMPFTERKRMSIDQYTGSAYVETDSPKTAKYKKAARKENRKQVALAQAVTEIVDGMTVAGIDWRTLSEADVLASAQTRKKELITISEMRAELSKEISGENAADLGAKATAFNQMKAAKTHKAMDLPAIIKRMEGGNDTQQEILETFRGDDQTKKNGLLKILSDNPDLEDANDLIIIGRHYGAELDDAPAPLSDAPLSAAVSAFTNNITYRGKDKSSQTISRNLFTKMMKKIKGLEEDSSEIGDDIKVSEYDLAVLDLDEKAPDFDEDADATMQGDRWDSVRDKLRSMGEQVHAINGLRETYRALPEASQELMNSKYNLAVAEHRKPLFDALYDFTFLLRPGFEQRLIRSLPKNELAEFKDRFSFMTTRDFTNADGLEIKGATQEQSAALKGMIDEVTQILDGVMYQPQSVADRKMETRRMATADLHRAERDKHDVMGMVKNQSGQSLVHPSVASKYANSYLETISPRLDNAVRDFIGLPPQSDLRKSFRYNVSSDSNVRGVTTTRNGEYGDGVYLKTVKNVDSDFDVAAVKNSSTDAANAARLTELEAKELDFSVNSTIWMREAIRDLSNKANLSLDERLKMQKLLEMERTHWDVINDITKGQMVDQKVTPVFARIRSPLDLTSSTVYELSNGSDASSRHLIMKMAESKVLNAEGVQAAVDMFGAPMTGREMYDAFTNDANGLLHTYGKFKNGANSRLEFNKMLKDMGYDGLHTDEGDVVFDPAMVKDANSFKGEDALLFDGEAFGGDMKLTGQVVEEMMVQNAALKNPAFVGVARESRRMGIPAPVLDVTEKIFKGRRIEGEDVNKISTWSTVKNFFRENSSLFRQLGANWFGDMIQPKNGIGTFEKHDAMLSRRLAPILAKMNALPDSGGKIKQWNRRNRGLAMGALDVGQPASHKRIIEALRRGRGAVNALDRQEREVAMEIGAAFNDELTKMKALGLKVGDARKLGSDFYVPQVYDRENILSNPSRFRAGLVEVLKREQNMPDFDPADRKSVRELGEIVDTMAHRLTKGYDPTTDGEVQSALGNPFAARVINLKPGDYDFMDQFLVQDLQGILAKYYDRTIRKRVMTEQFGVNGHGFNAYVDTAEGGIAEGLRILKRSYSPSNEQKTQSGMSDVDELLIPPLRLTPERTKELEARMRRLLGNPETAVNNKQAAIHTLMEAMGEDAYTYPQYAKRVEAIVNAAVDFSQGPPSSTTVAKMRQMEDVLNKKPIDGGSGQEARYKVSRVLKSFTSVSLLGFTTFTSLPDLALPLVRSGNMRAFAKTWAKYSTDPSYRAAAKNIGVGVDNLMHERMVQMSGDGNQKFANAFFNATMLTPWTNTMREVASLVGFESFKSEIDRALRMARKGQTSKRSYQTAVRYLERYGLTGEGATHDFLKSGSFRIDALPKDEAIEMQVQMAMMRFTNEAIFTPNPNDVPMWAQTPWGSMMFQLKSFPLMMARLQGYIVDEFKAGNVAPAFYMLTAGVGAGAVSVGVKDLVQLRGGEDERSGEVRKRRLTESKAALAELWGVEEGDELDWVLGWYLDGLLAVGGLGIFGEMLYNTTAQIDNGKYGFVRTMSAVFGPQVGTAELVFNAGAAAGQVASNAYNDEDKNAKIRTSLRDLYGRIPVAGRISGGPTGREAFVDAVGGEAKKPGRPKKSKLGSSKFGNNKFNGGGFD